MSFFRAKVETRVSLEYLEDESTNSLRRKPRSEALRTRREDCGFPGRDAEEASRPPTCSSKRRVRDDDSGRGGGRGLLGLRPLPGVQAARRGGSRGGMPLLRNRDGFGRIGREGPRHGSGRVKGKDMAEAKQRTWYVCASYDREGSSKTSASLHTSQDGAMTEYGVIVPIKESDRVRGPRRHRLGQREGSGSAVRLHHRGRSKHQMRMMRLEATKGTPCSGSGTRRCSSGSRARRPRRLSGDVEDVG